MQIEIIKLSIEDKKKYYIDILEISKKMKKWLLRWIIWERYWRIDEKGNNLNVVKNLSYEKYSMKKILNIYLYYFEVNIEMIVNLIEFEDRWWIILNMRENIISFIFS